MAENKNLTLADDEKLTLEMKTFQIVGVDDYNALLNIPKINGIEVSGEKTLDDYDIKKKSEANAEHTALEQAEKANSDAITSHIENIRNPHGVTAKQINALPISASSYGLIQANADLNDYISTVGVYECTDASAQTITNRPDGVDKAFILRVYNGYGVMDVIQEVIESKTGKTFFRHCGRSFENMKLVYSYGDWQAVYSTANKPTKKDVGLSNVDNTADADKPVATQTTNGLMSSADKTKLDNLSATSATAITNSEIDTIMKSYMKS